MPTNDPDARLDQCHRSLRDALKSMLVLRGIVGSRDMTFPIVDLDGEAQERGKVALQTVVDYFTPAQGTSDDVWASFAAHVPPGMPVLACGKEGGSWHRAVYLACEELSYLLESNQSTKGILLAVAQWLPVDARDVERIRGYMDREWGGARLAAQGRVAVAVPGARSSTESTLEPEALAIAGPPAEPHLAKGEVVIPPVENVRFKQHDRALLKALLERAGHVVPHGDLGLAAWNDEVTAASTIRKAIGRLKQRLTKAGWVQFSNRIEDDRDPDGAAGYVLRGTEGGG